MYKFETTYALLLEDILFNGKVAEGRNGGTNSLFGKTLEIDMSQGNRFPLLLGRKMYYKGVLGELAAFINGASTVEEFKKHGCNYWESWADESGQLELDYGTTWTDSNGVNQLQDVIKQLKSTPHSRRILINSWRPERVINGELSLPCCHYAYQWHVTETGHLDMIWIQRSVDMMIGLPSDIILAAAFNIMIAQLTGHTPGKIIMQLGDCHIYHEHVMNALKYITRVKNVLSWCSDYPTYTMEAITSYKGFTKESISIAKYTPAEPLSFELKA